MRTIAIALLAPWLGLLAGCAKVRVGAPQSQALAYRKVSIAVHPKPVTAPYTEFQDAGDFEAQGATVAELIAKAYDVPSRLIPVLVAGGPAWVYSRYELYDIHGFAPSWSVGPWLPREESVRRRRVMLRRMLMEHFGLALRVVNRRMPVYIITVAKGGVKLKAADVDEQNCPLYATTSNVACHLINGGQGQGIYGRAASIEDTSKAVEVYSDRPIVDRTRVKDLYQIRIGPWLDMQYAYLGPPAGARQDGILAARLPTMFQALKQFGLDLKPGEAKVKVYQIEAVRRPSIELE